METQFQIQLDWNIQHNQTRPVKTLGNPSMARRAKVDQYNND